MVMAKNIALMLLGIFCLVAITEAIPEGALITHLPGFNGTFPSKHYSGYVTIDESHGKNLFYYFVVSERNPSKDPVVLWLNGGPGCSSFDGFVYEHGPFNFEAVKPRGSLPQLHLNPHSWSKVSNIIYLDSPAGVGLSYSSNIDDYYTGDLETASDTHLFLLKWFEQYPEFLSNPFYISGESYAGVYVPTLASEVANGIDAGLKPTLNFKGYMVGNGVTDNEFDGNALVPFAHGMGLISDDLFKEIRSACNESYWNPSNGDCENFLSKVDEEINDLNIYDILEPCYHSPEVREISSANIRLPSSFRDIGETDKILPVRKRMFGRAWPLRAPVREGFVPTWPQLLSTSSVPCTTRSAADSEQRSLLSGLVCRELELLCPVLFGAAVHWTARSVLTECSVLMHSVVWLLFFSAISVMVCWNSAGDCARVSQVVEALETSCVHSAEVEVMFEFVAFMDLQCAMHYSWSTEARARRALANVSALLRPAGTFIGTAATTAAATATAQEELLSIHS